MVPGHSFHYKTNVFVAFCTFWTDLGLVMDSGHSLVTENGSRAQFSLQNQWFSCILSILEKSETRTKEWSLSLHRKWFQGTVFITKPIVFVCILAILDKSGTSDRQCSLLITENASRAQFSLQNQWFSCILAILDRSGTSDREWSLTRHRKSFQGTVFITKPMVLLHFVHFGQIWD